MRYVKRVCKKIPVIHFGSCPECGGSGYDWNGG